MALIEVRCKGCDTLLGYVTGDAEIECPECHGKNSLSIKTKKICFYPNNSKHERQSSSGKRFY